MAIKREVKVYSSLIQYSLHVSPLITTLFSSFQRAFKVVQVQPLQVPGSRDSGRPRLGWNEGGRNAASAYEISWNDHRLNQRLKSTNQQLWNRWFSSLQTPGYVFSKPLASASKTAWWNVKTTYPWLGAHDLYSSVHRSTNGTRCPERIAGWKLTHSIGTASLPDIQKLCAY